MWADLDRDRRVGGSRPNKTLSVFAISSFEVRDFNSSSCLAVLRVKGREVQCDVNKLLCEVIEAKYTGVDKQQYPRLRPLSCNRMDASAA